MSGMDSRSVPAERPRVFVIGLPKTGTSTLAKALRILGYDAVWNPLHWRKQIYEGNYRLPETGWDAVTNFGEHFYPQLDREYPGSKFVLTLREDSEAWLRSWKRQIGESVGNERVPGIINRRSWYRPGSWWWLLRTVNSRTGREGIDFQHVRIEVFGSYKFSEARCRYVYELHKRNALEYFRERPGDLLVMDVTQGHGWERLCPFLGLEVPSEAFPHVIPPKSHGKPEGG
jgi:hypothetical protein